MCYNLSIRPIKIGTRGGQTDSFFTLTYSDSCCKALYKKGTSVVSYGQIALASGTVVGGKIANIQTFGNAVLKALRQASGKPITQKQVVVALPEEKVFIQVIEIPKVDEDKIFDVIRWQSEKLLSFPLENVYLDYRVLEEKDSRQKVAIIAAQKDAVDSLVLSLNQIGLTVVSIDSVSSALASLLGSLSDQLYVVVNIEEPDKADIIVVKNSIPLLSTAINFARSPSQLENKIKETIQFYLSRKEADKKISQVILCGDLDSVELGTIHERVGTEVRWVTAASLLKKRYRQEINRYFINLGLYRQPGNGFNLLPPEVKEAADKNQINVALGKNFKLALLALFCAVLASVVFFGWQYLSLFSLRASADLAVQSEAPNVAKLQEARQKVAQINQKLSTLKQLSQAEPAGVSGAIKEIIGAIPQGVLVDKVEYKLEEKKITLSGSAPERQSLLDYRQKLSALSRVDKALLPLYDYNFSQNIPYEIEVRLK